MFDLDPASRKALDEFCDGLSDNQARFLRGVVDAIRQDPSGRRSNPGHSYARHFHTAEHYVGKVPKGVKVWEMKTKSFRALFYTAEITKDGVTHRRLSFLPMKKLDGARFFTADEAPWPHKR